MKVKTTEGNEFLCFSSVRESLELQKVTFVCGASPKKIFRKCRDFNVPIMEEKHLGLDSNKI